MSTFNTLKDSIYAPATSTNKAGIIVVRISGPDALKAVSALQAKPPKHKTLEYCAIYHPKNNKLIDNAVIAFFKGPHSFTGEDVVEISIHGSKAVLYSLMDALACIDNLRVAGPGEFSMRAFLNNKMDLTQAEGLLDLINAETDAQKEQALKQMSGSLSSVYEVFSQKLLYIMSLTEALIDFPDEDLPLSVKYELLQDLEKLKSEISNHLESAKYGEKIREGFYIAIIGPTNAGKSSLINKIAKRDVAIVSDIAGTTRDVIEVQMDINGYPVTIADTAGIRESTDHIEQEGIKRTIEKSKTADLKIALFDATNLNHKDMDSLTDENTIIVYNKTDLTPQYEFSKNNAINISVLHDIGIDGLIDAISRKVEEFFSASMNSAPITRQRHAEALKQTLLHLNNFSLDSDIEIAAEHLRLAATSLGRITGKFDVESLLGSIFSQFCIGK